MEIVFCFVFFFPCVMVKRGEGWGRDFFVVADKVARG